ncbi:hypothetical protein A0257_03320 [Hymenobacter psoromatis]|nr:hypothetical protein A0257_03320 [Hymenobacter psoromatis]
MLSSLVISLFAAALASQSPPAAPPLPAAFQRQLTASHLRFRRPAGAVPVPVVANAQMSYAYAVRFAGKGLEVRYAIQPLGPLLAEYHRAKKQKNSDMVDPNELYPTLLLTVVANIAGGQFPKVDDFPVEAMRREFRADWGGTTLVAPARQFAPGYKYCMVVALHKRDVADAYCFYLFNKREAINDLMRAATPDEAAFHALRFE